ncbi:hypothetical protein B296_00031262 [Ensete ventricosum]|uniref:Retrotransposon gag domain-containing protein n=1 Tax=Ensete ventricosum TaxID=4639 RepID=A0A427AGQ0_ENSVE|nr:hypothetical protein B296_00031262 [Ensete ventricosum]
MIQAIVPYIPQLAQAPMHQCPDVPRQMLQQEAPQSRPTQGEHPDSGALHHPPIEATIENPNALVSQPVNHSRDVMRTPLESDVVSSDSTNSVREQLCQVNQRLDEVQRDFVRSKEIGETTKGGSPFAPEILDKPIPSSFRLLTLEPYDGSIDPSEHVAMFRAQMALYDTSDALMCCTFPTTLRGSARIFATEVRRMPDTHPTLAIQAFLMELRPSRFFWSLIERPSSMVPEMLQRVNQYVVAETLVAGKREDHKKSRGDKP